MSSEALLAESRCRGRAPSPLRGDLRTCCAQDLFFRMCIWCLVHMLVWPKLINQVCAHDSSRYSSAVASTYYVGVVVTFTLSCDEEPAAFLSLDHLRFARKQSSSFSPPPLIFFLFSIAQFSWNFCPLKLLRQNVKLISQQFCIMFPVLCGGKQASFMTSFLF